MSAPAERTELRQGWEALGTEPGAAAGPAELPPTGWLAARVPGTAAGALHDAGEWAPGDPFPTLDEQDWWFRTRVDVAPAAPGERVVLCLDGVATLMEAYADGHRVKTGDSMWAAYEVDLPAGARELAICCRALGPRLLERRRPRARWRARIADNALRFFRTALLGRAPGFAPGPAPVGPWRPVAVERRRLEVTGIALRARLEGDAGVLAVSARAGGADAVHVELDGPSGTYTTELARNVDGTAAGELRIPDVARWWPHTHGEPVLHDVLLRVGDAELPAGRVGFRTLTAGATAGHDVERDGLDLHVNGVRVFARGAVWTPVDPIGLDPEPAALYAAVEQVRDAGMNMLRVPGIGLYESPAFHDLCDELGVLVWQDLMLANFDYPTELHPAIAAEAAGVVAELGSRPSFAVLCGGSEIEQQAAMLGLDPAIARGELLGATLPALLAGAGVDAVYVPNAPCGGTLPFRPGQGIANYYGVGGYRRPLDDARRAGVRFAAECLAFANVPGEAVTEALGVAPTDPRWKAGVPRDHGSPWDFEDVRDHYLRDLFGVDPGELRRVDAERYLELSRAVSGEVMAEVLGEWRRAGSPCGGALVMWLRDLMPGAGWGVVDHRGVPKAAYHHLRRALAPVAVWTVDEGLGGIAVHVANDRPAPLRARLRVSLYRDLEQRRDEAAEELELAPHSAVERDVEALLGHFADAAYAYRFGPPGHDAVVASLEGPGGELLAQAFRFPAGRPLTAEPAERLGLAALACPDGAEVELVVRSRRLAHGVRVHASGFDASDDAFSVEPGGMRRVRLRPRDADASLTGAALTALNLRGRVGIAVEAVA